MAKRPKATQVNVAVLTAIASGPEGVGRVSQADGIPLVNAGLIEVDTTNVEDGNALARVTDAGKNYLSNLNTNTNKEKPMYGVMTGFVPPPSMRGNRKGAGAPTIYPFATMEVGQSFFVSNTDKADAAKKLGSTVSQFNMKNRTATDQTETKEVTNRKTKEKETKVVPIYKQDKKFVLRAVKAGETYGEWKAPESGAVIFREM